ncbi:gp53-like domain-containing protein [Enterobacter roggenkampii]|uniref:gp53-like domain-containing protein n=1 Tax=Enterobacter roggenkampii TaxID=1812935 RepID=UPI002005612F|nr:phage tail protein [Enterobacter roggenkampii]MCK7405422.1 phage tail protein [Enterobacter roggenkampii]
MALQLLAANNAQSVLAAGISASATSLTLNTGTGALFPAPVSGTSFFKLTLIDAATGQLTEIVHVTARTGDTLTIDRAQEGTLARAWSANDIVANMMTAGTLSYIMSNLQPLDATLTALAGLATGANKLPYFTGTDTAAQTDLTSVGRDIIGKNTIAEILTYLTLKSAAQRDVGTGTNQIPDMNSFTSGTNWMKFPSGKIIQWGYTPSSNSAAVIVNFPIPFPTQCYGVTGAGTDASAANIAGCQIIDKAGFNLSAWLVAAGSAFNRTATNISWLAIGV